MAIQDALQNHLKTGFTTVARAWGIERKDGKVFGFTDHDLDLVFDGMTFRANTGLSAVALEQTTGLSVDNTEALGALTDASVTEVDIEAGRFDGAEVVAWLVNWADASQRTKLFRGTIGELRRSGGAFQVELRGLTEALNKPVGRVYQKPCTAVLGDSHCMFSTDQVGYFEERPVETVVDQRLFSWQALLGFEPSWFARGKFEVLTGDGAGLSGLIKNDSIEADVRTIELWEPLRATFSAGDVVRLVAGCDKRFDTCRLKFANFLNFQGFPDIPGDDWLISAPQPSGVNQGGSLR